VVYAFTLPATDITSFAVTTGALPAGLTLDASAGVISGTPTTLGSVTFTISGSGSFSQTDRQYTIAVAAAPVPPAAPAAPTAELLAYGGVSIPAVFPFGALGLILLGAALVSASRRRERKAPTFAAQ
jgi:hypothetical protein